MSGRRKKALKRMANLRAADLRASGSGIDADRIYCAMRLAWGRLTRTERKAAAWKIKRETGR